MILSRLLPLKNKDYRGVGHLHYFTLESISDMGFDLFFFSANKPSYHIISYSPSTVAKFASPHLEEVRRLYGELDARIIEKRRERNEREEKKVNLVCEVD